MQDPWILGCPVGGAEGVPASVAFRGSVIRGHCRAGRTKLNFGLGKFVCFGPKADSERDPYRVTTAAVAAGLPAILKKPLIFPCDGLDFLPNVLCPLLRYWHKADRFTPYQSNRFNEYNIGS